MLWLKKQPLEVLLFAVAPLLAYGTLFFFFGNAFLKGSWNIFSQIEAKRVLFDIPIFQNVILLLIFYVLYKGGSSLAKKITREKQEVSEKDSGVLLLLHAAQLLFVFICGALLITLIVSQLATIPDYRVFAASERLMAWDEFIFGVPLPFWLNSALGKYDFLDVFLTTFYRRFDIALFALLVALFLFEKDLFRKFVVAFFLVAIISIPVWYVFPAISPDEMYYQNIFNTHENQFEQAFVADSVKNLSASFVGAWSNIKLNYFAVTTFPSMHVAWGILIAYFAYLLWRPLALGAFLWAAINALSAIYTLQHYGVDIFSGIGVAVVALFLTSLLFKIEKKYYIGREPYRIINAIQKDTRLIIEFVRTIFYEVKAALK